jgi:hypothetical protein
VLIGEGVCRSVRPARQIVGSLEGQAHEHVSATALYKSAWALAYVSQYRLERGMRITIDDMYFAVKHVTLAKHGDRHNRTILCRPAFG